MNFLHTVLEGKIGSSVGVIFGLGEQALEGYGAVGLHDLLIDRMGPRAMPPSTATASSPSLTGVSIGDAIVDTCRCRWGVGASLLDVDVVAAVLVTGSWIPCIDSRCWLAKKSYSFAHE